MASRKLSDLTLAVESKAHKLLALCKKRNVDILVYCTYRTVTEQAILYRKGRGILNIERKADQLSTLYKRPDLADILINVGPQYDKRIVTWAAPGQSMHNYRLALDSVPIVQGKLQWDESALEWEVYGNACGEINLEWAGTWSIKRREYPHAQDLGISWRDLIEDYDYARED